MPSNYGDLNKSVSDLFKNDFDAGKVKLEYKFKANNGVEVKFKGDKSNKTNKISFENESTFTTAGGLKFKEKVTSKDEIKLEITKKNVLMKGTSFTGDGSFSTKGGYNGSSGKFSFDNNKISFESKYGLGKSVEASAVFGMDKFSFGITGTMDPSGAKPMSNELAFAYKDSDMAVCSKLANMADIEASLYHTPNPATAAALRLTWKASKSSAGVEIGGSYKYDSNAAVKFKVNEELVLGLAYTQALRKGVNIGLSASLNPTKPNEDTHSLGCSLKFSS